MYMDNSDDLSQEFKLSEEFNKAQNKDLYDIIEKAYNILMENNKVIQIPPKDIINMLTIRVIMGTMSVYKKLQESENNEISSSNNILDEIEYVKFIKAKLFSKIIDNEEAIVLYKDNLNSLRFAEGNGFNIKCHLALVNFQSEIIDLYNREGDDAVDYTKLEYPKEKKGGKKSRRSRKTKRAKKSRRTRRRRRN